MTEMIEYMLPLYSLSNIYWCYKFQSDDNVSMNLAIIGLALGIINLSVPMNDITKILFHEDIVNIVHLPISHVKKNFDTV